MINQQAIVLTKAMARVIKDNRLSLETVLDYSKMRELFSLTDLAAFWALQTHAVVQPIQLDLTYALFDKSWARSAKPEQAQELASVLIPLSSSETVTNYLRDQLFMASGQELDPSATPVQVVDLSGSGIALILDRGAGEYLAEGVNKFTVMRSVMQMLLKYGPVSELGYSDWFRRYLILVGHYSKLRPPQPVIN